MQCDEFEDRINAVLDERGRLEWDAELSLHCDTCPRCREMAANYDALLDGFYALTAPQVPQDLALRVVADMRPRASSRQRLAVAAAMLATAASLVLVAVPLFRGWSDRSQADASRRVASAGNPNETQPLEAIPFVPGLLAIADSPDGDPYAGLAKETGQGLANVILYVPGVGGGKGIIDVEADGAAGEPAWALQMSEGLRPISDSVTETFYLLLQSFPVSQLAARG